MISDDPTNDVTPQPQKYDICPETLTKMSITDENGVTRDAYVCQIVALRDLETPGPNGTTNIVAKAGERGGFVEVELDGDGKPMLPVQPNEDGAPDPEHGDLKGLSQRDNSWVHEGTTIVGGVNVRDDAQFVGPDALSTGNDTYKDTCSAGGSDFRSRGDNTFENGVSVVDAKFDAGSAYTFSGQTAVDGPATFKAGVGSFYDDQLTGEATLISANRDGSHVTIQGAEGPDGIFNVHGATIMDDVNLTGSGEIGPGVIIQDSDVSLNHNSLAGEITLVNQSFDGKDVEGKAFADDKDVDAIATPIEPKDAATLQYDTTGVDQSAYRAHIDEMAAHAYGEVFGDTSVQAHEGDIIAGYQEGYIATVSAAPEGTSHEGLEAADPSSKAYLRFQEGANDAATEDSLEGKTFAAGVRAWYAQSDERGKAQLQGGGEAMYYQTAGKSQQLLGDNPDRLPNNPNAGAGLVTEQVDPETKSKYQALLEKVNNMKSSKDDGKDKGMELD